MLRQSGRSANTNWTASSKGGKLDSASAARFRAAQAAEIVRCRRAAIAAEAAERYRAAVAAEAFRVRRAAAARDALARRRAAIASRQSVCQRLAQGQVRYAMYAVSAFT